MIKSELLEERFHLLERVAEINSALEQFGRGAVEIRTSRNLRNSMGLRTRAKRNDWDTDVLVYADETLTFAADEREHKGFVSDDDAAWLVANGYGEYVITRTP